MNPFIILFTRDVDNAFPTLFQDGVDWILWKTGVQGKLRQMTRLMEKNLHGVLRINGHFSDPVHYKATIRELFHGASLDLFYGGGFQTFREGQYRDRCGRLADS